MNGHSNLRKRLYVSGAIQGRILCRVTLYWVLYHLFLWHVLFLTTGALVHGHVVSFAEAYRAFFADNLMLLACAVAVFPLIFRDMLRMTNRVAGPFVRFERALKEMARGQRVEKITLRKGDLVDEFLEVFNQFVEYRNRELERDRDAVEAAPSARTPEAEQNGLVDLPAHDRRTNEESNRSSEVAVP